MCRVPATSCSRAFAEAGKAFFEGAGGCAGCHSPTGDLAGISRKYSAAVLQARFLYPQQRRRTATVTDADGKQYSGDLLSLTNYDVAIQDAGGWYRSWPLSSVKIEMKDALAAHRNLLDQIHRFGHAQYAGLSGDV